jgi:hypothetical protein
MIVATEVWATQAKLPASEPLQANEIIRFNWITVAAAGSERALS